MIVVCATCKTFIKEKIPYEDKSVSHSICKTCLKIELDKLEQISIKKGEKENE